MKWVSHLFAPFFDWIQIEVTSHCNAECAYCPHVAFSEFWQHRHMPMDVYQRLCAAFPRTGLVYLQGWGEPLLHPQFFEMVNLARQNGCRVGTTTNGMRVSAAVAEQIALTGVNIVGFSLAGTDESQDEIRRGTRIVDVLHAMQLLHEAKTAHGAAHPEIHVAYMWLRSQREAVRRLPALLEGRGVSQAVVTTLDFVPRHDLGKEVIQAHDREEEAFLKAIVADVIQEGKDRGVDVAFRLVSPFRTPGTCTENITRALFVSCRGLVSPCVLRNLPLTAQEDRYGTSLHVPENLIFGNVHDRSLAKIWREKSYKVFRRDHAKGCVPRTCAGCPKLYCVTHA